MNSDLYAVIGFVVVWCVKYVFVPFGVAVATKVFVDKLLQPQPENKRKKRSK